ncbi:MAG: hypothetical protein M1132_00260 [Chloroflexi bacterium]|nr:hypothetical protein [Chloroflexota bacterium]
MKQSPSEEWLGLLSSRKNRFGFLARMSALIAMLPALVLYALWQRGPALTSERAPRSSTPQTESQSFALVTTPELSTPESSMPGAISPEPNKATPAAIPTATALPLGMLGAAAQVISQDHLATLRLPKGTTVLDAEGHPPSSITIKASEVPLRMDIAVVGMAYAIGPEGATLNPPAAFSISFDPKAYYPFQYQDVDCGHMHMAYYDPSAVSKDNNSTGAPLYPWLDATVDLNTQSLTAKIDHLGTFILFCEVFGSPIS